MGATGCCKNASSPGKMHFGNLRIRYRLLKHPAAWSSTAFPLCIGRKLFDGPDYIRSVFFVSEAG
jgi:hypothetical protein